MCEQITETISFFFFDEIAFLFFILQVIKYDHIQFYLKYSVNWFEFFINVLQLNGFYPTANVTIKLNGVEITHKCRIDTRTDLLWVPHPKCGESFLFLNFCSIICILDLIWETEIFSSHKLWLIQNYVIQIIIFTMIWRYS